MSSDLINVIMDHLERNTFKEGKSELTIDMLGLKNLFKELIKNTLTPLFIRYYPGYDQFNFHEDFYCFVVWISLMTLN